MAEDVAAQNAIAADSTITSSDTIHPPQQDGQEGEQQGTATHPGVDSNAVAGVEAEKKSLENSGHHWLSHLADEMIEEFHWITHDEVRKILAWVAGRTDQKKNQCRDFSAAQVAFLTKLIEEKIMSKLTDAMAEVGKAIADTKAAIDPAHISAIDAAITALQEHDSSEDAEVADAIAGLQALHDAVVPSTGDTGKSS